MPQQREAAILEVDAPALVKPSDDYSPGQHLDFNLMRHLQPKWANWVTQIPDPQKPWCNNNFCLKLLSFGEIWYTVIDYKYIKKQTSHSTFPFSTVKDKTNHILGRAKGSKCETTRGEKQRGCFVSRRQALPALSCAQKQYWNYHK